MSTNTWIKEYLQLLDDCEARESRLTPWEVDFVSSIRSQLEEEPPRSLSLKQQDTLDSIWEKATKRG